MLAADVRVRRDVPRLRRRARTSGSTTPTRTSAGRKDKIIYGPGGILKPQAVGGWFPITLQYEAIRDIVVVVIHVIYFGLHHLHLELVAEARRQPAAGTEIATSTYGRPLVKKG